MSKTFNTGDVLTAADMNALYDDTGWVTIPLRSGFVEESAVYRPQVRRQRNVVFCRGAIDQVGVSAAGVFIIGDIPAGMYPSRTTGTTAASSSIATIGGLRFHNDGRIELTAGPTVGGYYFLDHSWLTD